jgi:hypothetical protein
MRVDEPLGDRHACGAGTGGVVGDEPLRSAVEVHLVPQASELCEELTRFTPMWLMAPPLHSRRRAATVIPKNTAPLHEHGRQRGRR